MKRLFMLVGILLLAETAVSAESFQSQVLTDQELNSEVGGVSLNFTKITLRNGSSKAGIKTFSGERGSRVKISLKGPADPH